MKRAICLISFSVAAACVLAQPVRELHQWKANFTIVDDEGNPVSGAQVTIGYDIPPPPGERYAEGKISGLTDTNGMFTASHRDGAFGLGFRVEKSGYYGAWGTRGLGIEYVPAKWNVTLTLVLKKIVNPIPMYARQVDSGPPAFGKPVGFDLVAGDWVAPYGRGVATDIIFTGELAQKAKDDFDYKLIVSFPNLGDGIQPFTQNPADEGSDLHSLHEAPKDGYKGQEIRTMSRHPGQGTKEDMNIADRNYFFRVRTVLDKQGNVKSALFGKIYGDFMQFRYYLNATPNDRNVEFDPKRNLIKNLKPSEHVTMPP